ncbi:hypothetical protein [Neobacillus sp. NPDC093127]|uniref:hypothetical protein n=1 Tax=Neobacillus sp. NPDC093127 TaxID=3364296 RepID=UPI003823AB66
MDRHLKQTFDIRSLLIGVMVNGGVLQIGSGAAKVPRVTPVGFTTVGTTLIPLGAAPLQIAVPLQSPTRQKL